MGLADKTLSEFIIELSRGKASAKEFKAELKGNGAEIPDSLAETLWAIIQKLAPGGGGAKGAGGAGTSQFAPRPGAGKFGGLAVPDSRERVKALEEEILAEGQVCAMSAMVGG